MDNKLAHFIEDLKSVCHKHGLCFYTSYDGEIVVTDFDSNILNELNKVVDERLETVKQQRILQAELEAKYNSPTTILQTLKQAKLAQEQLENERQVARDFIARAVSRPNAKSST